MEFDEVDRAAADAFEHLGIMFVMSREELC